MSKPERIDHAHYGTTQHQCSEEAGNLGGAVWPTWRQQHAHELPDGDGIWIPLIRQ